MSKDAIQGYVQTMNWYLNAVSRGYALSQYSFSQDDLQNSAQVEWYLKVDNQGHTTLQYNVGVFAI